MKKQTIYIDMDGTIADLYNEPNWLKSLRNEESGLFIRLRPLTSEKVLLKKFPKSKFRLVILSMTPKGATQEYCEKVKREKEAWLSNNFPSIKEKIFIKYGNNKNLKNSHKAILIDDNEIIRNTFNGVAIHPQQIIW